MNLQDLDLLAEEHRLNLDHLRARLAELEARQQQLRAEWLPLLRSAVSGAKASRKALADAIDAHRELFARPKTRIMHGIELGLRKSQDAWSYPPDPRLCALIRKELPAEAPLLIEVRETPAKKSLRALKEGILRRLGISISPGADQVRIEPVDGEVDKLLAALMGDLSKELESLTP